MLYVYFILQILVILNSPGRSDFEPQTIDANLTIGYGIALGDVDGDKKPDILVADKKQFAWYRNGDWKKFIMIENLTVSDNVCITAEDINGDGKVEVAVGAQWNPSETKDKEKSGSVHFLVRPEDPTKPWTAVPLYHEPTIHRMRWIRASDGVYYLLVLPLHGKDNNEGMGTPVNLLVFRYPDLLQNPDPAYIISTNMHLTHNLEITGSRNSGKQQIYIAGKEGLGIMDPDFKKIQKLVPLKMRNMQGAGEVRTTGNGVDKSIVATIEPMHGNNLVVYTDAGEKKLVLDTTLNEGHALAAGDLLGLGYAQVVAGWRRPDKDGRVGIRLYSRKKGSTTEWEHQWIDENEMACEDLQVMDLNADGRMDIIASGRATHNLKIYWNIVNAKK